MRRNIVLAGLLGFLSSATFGSETVTVTDISGAKSTGSLKSWSMEKLILESTSEREFPRTEVRSVSFNRPSPTTGEPTVWLSNGDHITARAVTAANDMLIVSWPVLGEAALSKIPLEQVTAIIFEWPADINDRLRFIVGMQTLPPGNDLVMLSNGDRSSGDFERLDAAHVELKIAANSLKLDRSRVRAVRFNPELTTVKRQAGRRAVLRLTDGSQLTVTSIELLDDVLNLKSPDLGNLTLPVDSLVACHLFGDRLVPISDYEPSKVEFTPYLSAVWPLVRNANVRRGPLKLRGVDYVTGLGMHSRMVVTYNLKGREREFQGTVGIDDLAGGEGSVLFALELDGHRVWTSPDLSGRSPAMRVPTIDLRGRKQLTLIVEYGQFADVSDYADWCDAVLIMDQESGTRN